MLLGTHLYLTAILRFPQRYLLKALKLYFVKDHTDKGDISPFSSLMVALAANIGAGNIIGVGVAIAAGGPGADFRCWLTGVLGMATRYSEGLLAIKYRVENKDGNMSGGPMFVLERGLNSKWLGTAFAVFTAIAAFGIGNLTQGNAAAEQQLVFVVPPPWWRTAWAQAGFVALLLLALFALAWAYRQRLKRKHAWQLAEQKQALAEQASEAKSRFLATLGHEVRTPMTGVLGMSELLQGTPLDARQRRHVDAIRRAGEHLLRLVNDALDLARIEAGRLELANADFALRPLLDEVAALMAPVAERKGLAFIDGMAPDAPTTGSTESG